MTTARTCCRRRAPDWLGRPYEPGGWPALCSRSDGRRRSGSGPCRSSTRSWGGPWTGTRRSRRSRTSRARRRASWRRRRPRPASARPSRRAVADAGARGAVAVAGDARSGGAAVAARAGDPADARAPHGSDGREGAAATRPRAPRDAARERGGAAPGGGAPPVAGPSAAGLRLVGGALGLRRGLDVGRVVGRAATAVERRQGERRSGGGGGGRPRPAADLRGGGPRHRPPGRLRAVAGPAAERHIV